MSEKSKILFVSENVTLAQVVRLVTLARGLSDDYEVHFACSEFPAIVFGGTRFQCHTLETLSAERADRALRAGRRLYEQSTLVRYVAADRALIDAVRPSLVVGDLRWSLSTSAELCGVPSAVLINAYFSPFARRERFPVPDHPIISWLGEALTERYFPQAIPHVFRHFAEPLNAARKQYGLPPVGSLLDVLGHGDHTLYPDDPWLTPVDHAPATHGFLGPVAWEPDVPEVALPASTDTSARPLVYVTLGSSGNVELLPLVVRVLGDLPVTAVVATAGRVELSGLPANVVVRPYVRGSELCRRARVVISNGGSTTGYQALSEGTPVLGVPSNLDQYLATEAIVRAGAGLYVKGRRADRTSLRAALEQLLEERHFHDAALNVAERFRRHDAVATFRGFVGEVTSSGSQGGRGVAKSFKAKSSASSP
jgi:UDP:flavonoid glycosyltransferase YjiC (YdhE family)